MENASTRRGYFNMVLWVWPPYSGPDQKNFFGVVIDIFTLWEDLVKLLIKWPLWLLELFKRDGSFDPSHISVPCSICSTCAACIYSELSETSETSWRSLWRWSGLWALRWSPWSWKIRQPLHTWPFFAKGLDQWLFGEGHQRYLSLNSSRSQRSHLIKSSSFSHMGHMSIIRITKKNFGSCLLYGGHALNTILKYPRLVYCILLPASFVYSLIRLSGIWICGFFVLIRFE